MGVARIRLLLIFVLVFAAACRDGSGGGPKTDVSQIPEIGPWNAGVALPAEPQSQGDPARGRDILLGGDFMTCGIPFRLWSNPLFKEIIASGFGGSKDAPLIADRPGKNAELPYFLNVFISENGSEVVNANCLLCHGSQFNGEVVIGLGNPAIDFTEGTGGGNTGFPLTDALLDLLGLDVAEKAQLRKTFQRAAPCSVH